MNASRAVLLINIGSPDSYKTKDVRKYLKQFLVDKRVINIPAFFRYLLVYGIIAPFRAPKSAAKYKEIWTKNGSPLIDYSNRLKEKLQKLYANEADVYFAMRYGNPSLASVLNEIKQKNYSEITVCPVYPQNASSTTSSSVEEVCRIMKKWENIPNIKFVNDFWHQPAYIEALHNKVASYNPNEYDHVLISFHGLPLSQVYAAYNCNSCSVEECTLKPITDNKFCYRAQCYALSKILADKLDLSIEKYSVGFQSRLSKNWLSPFSDEILENLVTQGKKKVMVICPSFISDCLETIHEVAIEYTQDFKKNGGEKLFLVPALNADDYWVESFKNILEQ
ncbi:MAG: ferrochelatase [Salinivirgaceae bacterium]|nr:ferrochelatase [Salinivirgaceae bacterium]